MKINCHCHIFSLDCVPLGFRREFALDLQHPGHRLLHSTLHKLLKDQFKLDTWLKFAEFSIGEIADRLIDEMDEAGIEAATPLSVDLEFCEKYGGTTKSFLQQIDETLAAVQATTERCGRQRLFPFIGADPRREGIADLILAHLQARRFFGVKIYPVMGFLPDDERLQPVYDYCERQRVPVTAHCQNGGLPGFTGYYDTAHPNNWRPVLERFPKLVLNLAHNDTTGSTWQPPLFQLMRDFPHVYTDVSFDTEMFYQPGTYFRSIKSLLNDKQLCERVLYGTDWYMGRFLWTEKTYLDWFTRFSRKIFWDSVQFTTAEIRRLVEENPARFLGWS
ncbi:MAG TPA: amidohydrolase family protein [Candidatus Ozemobacteraceae bacterium]|nr:amidohydrolase family protein [Candidatus Ozemobacteraceae bacterium]